MPSDVTGLFVAENWPYEAEGWNTPKGARHGLPFIEVLASDEPALGDVLYEADKYLLGERVALCLQAENATYEYRRWERADHIHHMFRNPWNR